MAAGIGVFVVGAVARAQDLPPLTGKEVSVSLSVSDPQRFYPVQAQLGGVTGEAAALCKIRETGELGDCIVETEWPLGHDFGGATIKLASVMRVAPKTKTGEPTAGRTFRLKMNFGLR